MTEVFTSHPETVGYFRSQSMFDTNSFTDFYMKGLEMGQSLGQLAFK
jgi:hypothetical protein